MANWSNLRLIVTGSPNDVALFRRAAGAREGRVDTAKSSIFTAEMEYGEGGDLNANRARVFRRVFRTASYLFQAANDDYREHFAAVSRRFPTLAFVLVWSDPNVDSHGSYLLRRGRSRAWEVPPRTRGNIFKKHYRAAGFVDAQGKVDFDAEGTYDVDSEVFVEMMDVAERHWDEVVVDWLTKQRSRAAGSKGQ